MSLLSVNGASIAFGGVAALSNVSLEVEADSLMGFIGPNGAGKTTLMRVITGMLRPQEGSVLLNGVNITSWPIHRRIGAGIALAQQIVRPLRSFNLIDNVAFAAGRTRMTNPLTALFQTDRSEERDIAMGYLEMVGISDAATAMPSELPLGYLKRLEVARALALKPKLLLLDEPLAGLNQSEARSMADLIAGLAGSGRSILLIEHNIREVSRICPELYVQENGSRLIQGPADIVMKSPELYRAYLGKKAV